MQTKETSLKFVHMSHTRKICVFALSKKSHIRETLVQKKQDNPNLRDSTHTIHILF